MTARRRTERTYKIPRTVDTADGTEVNVLVVVEVDGYDSSPYYDRGIGGWLPGESREVNIVDVVEDRRDGRSLPDLMGAFLEDDSVLDDALVCDEEAYARRS